MKNIKTITIVGFGQFGQVMEKLLRKTGTEITILTRQDSDWSCLASADLIIPCVPISLFEGVIKKIAAHNPTGIVMDVCSVKQFPVEVMQTHLPPSCQIVASHPLFGPDTLKHKNANLKMVIHPVKVTPESWRTINNMWTKQGCSLIEMSPEEHDQQAAHTQALAFVIGQLTDQLMISSPLETLTSRLLKEQSQVVMAKSRTLARDIIQFNPESQRMLTSLTDSISKIQTTSAVQ